MAAPISINSAETLIEPNFKQCEYWNGQRLSVTRSS